MKLTRMSATLIVSMVAMTNALATFDIGLGAAVQNINYGGGSQTTNGANVETFANVHKTNVTPNFNLAYNFQRHNRFGIGIQLAVEPFPSSTASVTKSSGKRLNDKINGNFDLSILPGVMLSTNTELYGKLGYAYARRNIANADGAWSKTLVYSGYLLGFGVKTYQFGEIIGNKNIYAIIEYNYAHYATQSVRVINTSGNLVASSSLGLQASTGLLGLGYSF